MGDLDAATRYFEDCLRKGFDSIFEEQRRIAWNKIYSRKAWRADWRPRVRSGRLREALAAPNPSFKASAGSFTAAVGYPYYIRFLDMKRMGNYRIYNRPIWGILYRRTFRDMRFGFADWLREQIRSDITRSLQL